MERSWLSKRRPSPLQTQKETKEVNKKAKPKDFLPNLCMANPDTSYFYKLIKRTRNTGKAKSHVKTSIVTGTQEVDDPVKQTEIFADYYEILAVPDQNPTYNDNFLEQSQLRCSLIDQLADLNPDPVEPFSCTEVEKAVKSLNSNKAADEYGIPAEHVKYAGEPL